VSVDHGSGRGRAREEGEFAGSKGQVHSRPLLRGRGVGTLLRGAIAENAYRGVVVDADHHAKRVKREQTI